MTDTAIRVEDLTRDFRQGNATVSAVDNLSLGVVLSMVLGNSWARF